MILTNEQVAEFKAMAGPLIRLLEDSYHPHITVIVTSTGAEIVEGLASVQSSSPSQLVPINHETKS